MKYIRIFLILSLATATTLLVPDNFTTIQEGVDSAIEGDTILVSEGIYYENIFINQKSITIISSGDIENTILDGSINGPVIEIINVENDLVINGFIIQNGYGKYINGATFGGGIFSENSNLTLENILIQDNTAFAGGGICFYATDYTYKTPILINTIIKNNYASEGGGIFCVYHDLSIYESEIQNNGMDLFGSGGGIQCLMSNLELNYVTVSSNQSNFGGGVYLASSFSEFNHVFIKNNYSDSKGGGIWVGGDSNLNLYRSVLSQNISDGEGAGIFINQASLSLINSNIVYNNCQSNISGSGIYIYDGNSTIKNSIIFYNQCISNTNMYCNLGTSLSNYSQFEINYSNIEGSLEFIADDNNISSNPMFIDMEYYLNFNSPCIDAGDPSSLFDTDGTIADIGVYYFHQEFGCTDPYSCNYNSLANVDDGSCVYSYIGDVNFDCQLNILDIVVLVNLILEGDILSDEQMFSADINQDDNINIIDIVLIVNEILND